MGRTRKAPVETAAYAGFVHRILKAYGRRVGGGDIGALREMVELRAELDAQLAEAVGRLRSEPWCYSWAQIADELGMTRQAAQKRWASVEVTGGRQVGGQPARLR